MRYIIAVNAQGVRQPFLGLAPINHSQLVSQACLLGYTTTTSAGFALLRPDGEITTHYRSEGLGLAPAKEDASIIHLHYHLTMRMIPDELQRLA